MAEKVELFHEDRSICGQLTVEMRECVGRETFKSLLKDSILNWVQQGKSSVWIFFPAEFAHLAEIAAQAGFRYRYGYEGDFSVLKKQLVSGIGSPVLIVLDLRGCIGINEEVNASKSPFGEPFAKDKSVATVVDYSHDCKVQVKSPLEFFNTGRADVANSISCYATAEERKTAVSRTRDALLVDVSAFQVRPLQVGHFGSTSPVRRGKEHSKCHGPGYALVADCPFPTITGKESSYAVAWEQKAAISQTRDALRTHGWALVGDRSQGVHSEPINIDGRGHEQRQLLFWGYCFIHQKACNFVIDSGSSYNFIRESLIPELNLSCAPLPGPTSVTLMDSKQQVQASFQAWVPFSMTNYADCMLFIALPDPPADIVLGRPWASDVRAIHDCYENQYKFRKNGMDITLYPLTPSEVAELLNKINGTSSRG